MPLHADHVIRHLKELRSLTANEHGAQRVAWTPTWQAAREWFAALLAELPVTRERDEAGNVWVTVRGQSRRALLLGGHLDSVPNGGWLDGCLGVLASLEVLRAICERYDGMPPVTIRVVDWADEEGARFGRSLFGSSAFAGTHSLAADRVRTDKDGITLEQAMRDAGLAIDDAPRCASRQNNAAAYLELHIEQGPVLEGMGLPLGVVLGTKGVERHAITFLGQEAHSGSTPMAMRHDALTAAAKLALAIRPIAMRHADAVATMGSVRTLPGIVTAVVGRCETTLDMRDLQTDVLAGMLQQAQEASHRFAEEERCTAAWARIWSIEPVPFHADLIDLAEQAVLDVAGVSHRLPSGPLHDAAEVARAGIPTVMLFTQSLRGLSHNKLEDTTEEHLCMAVQALHGLALKTIDWIVSQPVEAS